MSYLTNPLTVERFKSSLEEEINSPSEFSFLLAVSGGVDSMVLLDLMYRSKFKIEVAHVNYHLREEQSNLDEKLVEEFCITRNIPFHLYSVEESLPRPKGSIQSWARDIRYRFFKTVLKEKNLDYLLTAHHMNDQLETFIIHLSRGSGLKGLSGIPSGEEKVLRPLLPFSRAQILSYAEEVKVPFREDQSNHSDKYLRNRIRHTLIPSLLETNDYFLENFERSIQFLRDAQEFISSSAEAFLNEAAERDSEGKFLSLNLDLLSKQHTSVRYEVLKSLGFEDGKEMEKLFSANSGSRYEVNNHKYLLDQRELKSLDNPQEKGENLRESYPVTDESGQLLTSTLPHEILKEISPVNWMFDESKLQFPLSIRHHKPGDEFYPIGMIGKKKVSKFFKDEKISILARHKTWLLCSGEDQILGILPLRQDRRFLAKFPEQKAYIFKLDL